MTAERALTFEAGTRGMESEPHNTKGIKWY